MTDVAPETDVEALVATVRESLSIEATSALSALDRLYSLLLRAEEFYKAHEVVERGTQESLDLAKAMGE